MVQCAVCGCKNNNNKKLLRNVTENKSDVTVRKIHFFCFPKNSDIQKQWILKCFRKDEINLKNSRICSEHFKTEDIQLRYRSEIIGHHPNYIKLKPEAIPSLKLPTFSTDENTRKVDDMLKIQKIVYEQSEEATGIEDLKLEDSGNVSQEAESNITQNLEDSEREYMKDLEITKLRQEINSYKRKINDLERETMEHTTLQKAVSSLFSSNQIKKLKTTRRVNWSTKDILNAIALHAAGPRAYHLLRKGGHPLPGVSTLRKWAQKIVVEPGILQISLNLMQNASLSNIGKVCVLTADEMKIKRAWEYDKRNDTILPPFSYVQVIMVRGLFENWKQPIHFGYDCKLTKKLLHEVIKQLEEINYHVVGMTSDLGGTNRGVWNELQVCQDKPFFKNPISNTNVYVFGDAPHLIKLLHNHFLDDGFLIDDKLITIDVLEELYHQTAKSDLNVTHKLTEEILRAKEAKRQKVKWATQLFSRTNSCTLTGLGSLGLMKNDKWPECADLLKVVNDWFDIFNSGVPESDSRSSHKAYGLDLEQQNKILEKMEILISKMRVRSRRTMLPFQKGILMSIKALKLLFGDMKSTYNIKYLLTYRLNQDVLEDFFSIMRANGNPKALDFKYRLKNYIIGRNESATSEATTR